MAEAERPREKLLQLGPEGLSDAELLAVMNLTYPIFELGDFIFSKLNGYCIKPSLKPTTTKTLKLNAISPSGHFDKDQNKFVKVNQNIKDRRRSILAFVFASGQASQGGKMKELNCLKGHGPMALKEL